MVWVILKKNILLNIFSLHGSFFSAVMLVKNYIKAVTSHSVDNVLIIFYLNRPKPAYSPQGLDWIVGPFFGCSQRLASGLLPSAW